MVCVWVGTWEVRNKMDCCDGLWSCCGGEETQVLHSEGRQTGEYCMHRERAACNEHMKREGRGYEVQLTALMAVCVFPSTGLLPAVCHALAGVCGSWSAAAHHELCGLWVMVSCSAVTHSCSSMPAVSLWWSTPTGAAQAWSEHSSEYRIYSKQDC